jgi:hypothetical protein
LPPAALAPTAGDASTASSSQEGGGSAAAAAIGGSWEAYSSLTAAVRAVHSVHVHARTQAGGRYNP